MALDPLYGNRIRAQAEQMAPQAFMPAPVLEVQRTPIPQPPTPAAGGSNASGDGGFPGLVLSQQGKGPKLAAEQLEGLKQRYLTERVLPREIGRKGATEQDAKIVADAFNSKADRWIADYLANGAGGTGAAAGPEGPETAMGGVRRRASDLTVGTLGGAAQLIPALGNLADYGYRMARGTVEGVANGDNWRDVYEGVLSGDLKRAARGYSRMSGVMNRGEQTALGAGADELSEFIGRKTDQYMSDKYRAASAKVHDAQGFIGTLEAIIDNPASIPGLVGQGMGSLAGAAPLRIPKVARMVQAMPRLAQTLTSATAVGAPQAAAATAQYEKGLRAQSFDELMADEPEANKEKAEALVQTFVGMGLPEAKARERVKNQIINDRTTLVGAAEVVANIGTAVLLPGAEAEAAGVRRAAGRNVLTRLGKASGSEAIQEGLAGGIEQAGKNVADNRPITEGVGNAVAINAVPAAFVGGLTHTVTGAGNRLRRRAQPTATETETTQGAANDDTTPPAATNAQPTPPTDGAPPAATSIMDEAGAGIADAQHARVVTLATEEAARRTARKTTKAAVANLDAEGVIAQAQQIAQESAGDEWGTMTGLQRLEVVEGVAETLNKVAKKDTVATTLAAMRETLNSPPTPPGTDTTGQGQQTEEVPVAPAPPESTPAAPQAPTGEGATPVAPPAPPAPPAASTAQEQAPETPPTLPAKLAGAKPRWNNGEASYSPEFESDVDKALYIIGQSRKSNQDAAYRQWLVDQGFNADSLDGLAATVRAAVAAHMGQAEAGTNAAPAVVRFPATNVMSMRGQTVATPAPAPSKRNALKTPKATTATKQTGEATTPAKPARKKAPLKASDRPKADAPTDEAGQPPQQTTADATPPDVDSPAPPARESGAAAVERIMGENIEGTDAEDLGQAIELAREGEQGELNRVIKELRESGDITPEQVSALREAAKPVKPSEEGLTEQTEATKPVESDLPYIPTARTIPGLLAEIIEGNEPNKIKSLLEGLQHMAMPSPYLWLAQKMAGMFDGMNVDLRFVNKQDEKQFVKNHPSRKAEHLGGFWHGGTNTLALRPDTRAEIILHEALHALTSNVLMAKARNAKIQQFQRQMETLLTHIQTLIKDDTNGARTKMPPEVAGRVKGYAAGPFSNTRELLAYGLTNPKVQEYLRTLPGLPGTRAGKNAWASFKDAIKQFFGAKTDETRNALDSLIETSGQLMDAIEEDPGLLNEAKLDLASDKFNFKGLESMKLDWAMDPYIAPSTPTKVDATPTTMAQRIWEIFSHAAIGIEKSMQEIVKAGGRITAANNPYTAFRKYTSDIAEMRNTDNQEVVQPLENWIAENWKRFKVANIDEFRSDLDKFLQNHHALNERNRSMWAEQVPLKNGMDLQRATLIDDAYDGKLTGVQLQTRLQQLAQQHATEDLDTWAAKNGARDPARARAVLADVAKRGFTEAGLADLNKLMDASRKRARERMEAAGIVTASDPFVDRGWNWYVPLKGSLAMTEAGGDYDVGSRRGSTRAFRDRNLKTMQGRSTNADNALSQLVVDMNQAATAQAETEFKSTLFEYVSDNQKLLGAQIRRWTGTPKAGYETNQRFSKKGTLILKPHSRQELPPATNGFIYNNGDEHFEVRLPQGSQLVRGIVGLRKVTTPWSLEESHSPVAAFFRGVGTATNVLARSYTTWSPTWQLMTAFLRDINYIPITLGAQVFDSPLQAGGFARDYAANLAKNMAAMGNVTAGEWNAILGDKSKMAAYAKANPDSYVAKLLAFREAGGSTEHAQSFNRETADEALFRKAKQEADGTFSFTGLRRAYDGFNMVTGNWAAMLENRGRVAAWEALVAQGMDPKEAAAKVKGVLDYSQSGEWGRMINVVHAFYRVGATDADTIRRTFTTPDGKLDKGKLARWVPALSAMGALAYMMAAAALGDDDDKKPRIRKFTAETLTSKILLPGPDGKVIGLPIAMGLPQVLMAPGILSAAVANGHMSAEEATAAYYKTLTRTSPLQPAGVRKGTGASGIASSWIQGIAVPTLAQPIVDLERNTSPWGTSIHTDHAASDKFASDQAKGGTAPIWKEMAGTLRELTGIDVFPETLQHVAKSYGGQATNSLLRWTVDRDNKEQQGQDSNAMLTALRLGVNDENFYYSKEMYQTLDRLEVAKRLMKHEGDEDAQRKWLRANPDSAKQIDAWKKLDKARDAYYKEIAAIRNNKLLAAQGRKDKLKLADGKLRRAVEEAQKVVEATQ